MPHVPNPLPRGRPASSLLRVPGTFGLRALLHDEQRLKGEAVLYGPLHPQTQQGARKHVAFPVPGSLLSALLI